MSPVTLVLERAGSQQFVFASHCKVMQTGRQLKMLERLIEIDAQCEDERAQQWWQIESIDWLIEFLSERKQFELRR